MPFAGYANVYLEPMPRDPHFFATPGYPVRVGWYIRIGTDILCYFTEYRQAQFVLQLLREYAERQEDPQSRDSPSS